VYDLSSRAKIELTGGDRVRWLNGMVTNNIRDLAQNFGVYAFLLNPQGHILGDLVTFQRGEGLLVNALVQLGGTRELSARKQKTRMASFCKRPVSSSDSFENKCIRIGWSLYYAFSSTMHQNVRQTLDLPGRG